MTPSPPSIPLESFFQDIAYVTMKVASGCNLKCRYCNVAPGGAKAPTMPVETAVRVARLLIGNSRYDTLNLEFHGGEPLLLPESWFEEVVGTARELAAAHGKTVIHPMQTNGTVLTPAKLEMVERLGIHIGISIDGPPEVNDRMRMSGRAAERGLKLLQEHRPGNHGTLVVVSPTNAREMYRVMEYLRSHGVQDFRINFLQPQGWGASVAQLSDDDMVEARLQIFQHMLDTDCSVVEGETEMLVKRLMYGRSTSPPLSCWEVECQAGRKYVAVDVDGTIHACGTDLEQHPLGTVFAPIQPDHVRSTLSALHRKGGWWARCFGCEAKRICHYSCPTSDHNDTAFRDSACAATKRLYAHFATREDDVIQVWNTLDRARRYPRTAR